MWKGDRGLCHRGPQGLLNQICRESSFKTHWNTRADDQDIQPCLAVGLARHHAAFGAEGGIRSQVAMQSLLSSLLTMSVPKTAAHA